jgi:hypothetical protein
MPEKDDTKVPEGRSKADVEKFIDLAMTRFNLAAEAESEWRTKGLDDLKFSIGDGNQWDEAVKAKRMASNAPCLEMNHIKPAVKNIVNKIRQQPPAPQISANGKGATKKVADVLEGMVRHVYAQSDGDTVHDNAAEYMARIGKGSWRLIAKYPDEDPDAEGQELYLEAILNPFALYSDPRTRKVDRSDKRFSFIIEDMPHEEYRAAYGDSDLAALTDMSSAGNNEPDWANKSTVRVAEYYYLESKPFTRSDGSKGFKITSHWAKINAIEILDERDLPGTIIPVFEVVGEDLIVDGKRHTAGIVRDAKDPQRLYNFQVSAMAAVLQKIPKAPVMGPKGIFTDPKWESANTEDYAYLEYDTIDANGNPVPAGSVIRNSYSVDLASLATMAKIASDDIKATTSVYEASLGQERRDESGTALRQRREQNDNANFNYGDNMARVVRLEARVMMQWFPTYYDVPRVQRIINPDGTFKHVGIYNSKAAGMEGFDPKSHDEFTENDIKEAFDIGVGRYDVGVSVGPSYLTRRKEATATQIDLLKVVPAVQNVAADVVVRNMDIPDNDLIADRLKKALPPGIADDDGTPEAKLADMQQKLTAMTQQHQALTQVVEQQSEIIKTKQVEQEGKQKIVEIQELSKQAIVKMQEATKLAVAQMNASKDLHETFADAEIKEFQIMHDGAHELAMSGQEHENAKELAEMGHAQALEQGEQANDNAKDQAVTQAALNPPAEKETGNEA